MSFARDAVAGFARSTPLKSSKTVMWITTLTCDSQVSKEAKLLTLSTAADQSSRTVCDDDWGELHSVIAELFKYIRQVDDCSRRYASQPRFVVIA